MTGYSIIVLDDARLEREQAKERYDEQEEGLWLVFSDQLTSTLKLIELFPLLYPEKRHPLREALLNQFPFLIIYQIKSQDTILIHSIFHIKQHPNKKLPS